MKTCEDEATQYENTDNVAAKFEESITMPEGNGAVSLEGNTEVKSQHRKIGKRVVVGAGKGLLIGGVSTIFMGMKSDDNGSYDDLDKSDINENIDNNEDSTHPEWIDEEVLVVSSVKDDMSFEEALKTARAEVGSVGAFEWRGHIYGNYTADEWDGMTNEQKTEFGNHFNWNHIDHSESDVVQYSSQVEDDTSSNVAGETVANDDYIEVISVNNSEEQTEEQTQEISIISNEVDVQSAESEIEVLGVIRDNETNLNLNGVNIDGQDIILIHVDNDMEFDHMEVDSNLNRENNQNDVIDIQSQNAMNNDLGIFSSSIDDQYTNNEGPDYSNDSVYEG